jgi:ABC-type lipoprotein export system ATPase subunit
MAAKTQTNPDNVVEVRALERTYGSGENAVHVLKGLDLSVGKGLLVALYGPSGSGKTTLLNLIGALDRPTAGSIHVIGKDIVRMGDGARTRLRRTQIGFIFQNYALIPTYTAYENVDLTLRLLRYGFFERRRRTWAALEMVGLRAWSNHVPDELSGGQRQRIAIARALALRPKLMLADEPTGGLDTRMARRILTLFRSVARDQGTTFLIVSHDPMVAEQVDMAYDLHNGQLLPHQAQLAAPDSEGETVLAQTN